MGIKIVFRTLDGLETEPMIFTEWEWNNFPNKIPVGQNTDNDPISIALPEEMHTRMYEWRGYFTNLGDAVIFEEEV